LLDFTCPAPSGIQPIAGAYEVITQSIDPNFKTSVTDRAETTRTVGGNDSDGGSAENVGGDAANLLEDRVISTLVKVTGRGW
jgi:hypothetical protein